MSRRKADNFLNFGIKYLNALQNRDIKSKAVPICKKKSSIYFPYQ